MSKKLKNIPKKYENLNFVPPKAAQEAAKKVLEWKEKYPDEVKAMTPVGWTRARQLADGDELSPDVIKRMYQFKRHKNNKSVNPKYKETPWKDNGFVSWEGWGSNEGIEWAEKMVKKMNEIDDKTKKAYCSILRRK